MSLQYFANIDENNIVVAVHVVSEEFLLENPLRYQGIWIETFFETLGKTYAGVGHFWDGTDFIEPTP